ncbi:rapid alkalinization factor-like [Andrographis paniculata]|uniref:rapid alkalinization factor-like n=1 Tax=Andrographis paniculata TaxID=175694 RepID=UPI0021E717BF|nr:rapid alkalinization factor-like [Andrographis paniculata]
MAGNSKLLLVVCLIASLIVANASVGADSGWIMPALRSGCRGTVAECLQNDDEEFEMDSESHRRILATRRYISYGALQRNSVPCSRRGASYYNCRPGAQANPYRRGCSAITRCRS